MAELKITIIIPCYNEAKRLDFQTYQGLLKQKKFFLVFVNDGSTDNTFELLLKLKQLFPENVEIINISENKGKAEAVRQGILDSVQSSQIIGFMDADFSTPVSEIEEVIIKTQEYEFVFGSRIKTLNNRIERSWLRHYLSRLSATIISIAIQLQVYDTQCGIKFFKQQLAKELFSKPFYSRWLFDVEIFLRLKQLYTKPEIYKKVFEFPLKSWQEKSGSRIKTKDFLRSLVELIIITRKFRKKS